MLFSQRKSLAPVRKGCKNAVGHVYADSKLGRPVQGVSNLHQEGKPGRVKGRADLEVGWPREGVGPDQLTQAGSDQPGWPYIGSLRFASFGTGISILVARTIYYFLKLLVSFLSSSQCKIKNVQYIKHFF